jgi:primase-polymerase (primpol)-like protein
VQGTLPQPGRKAQIVGVETVPLKQPAIEMYATLRYFTVTGVHLDGTPETIELRQTQLAELFARHFPDDHDTQDGEAATNSDADVSSPRLSDEEVLKIAFDARNGARIARSASMAISAPTTMTTAAPMPRCVHSSPSTPVTIPINCGA